jgi:hypothetical protein
MTPELPSSPSPTRAPRVMWLWLASLLLAFNALTALPQAPRLDVADLRAAALTAPVPVNAQFRDPAAAIKAAAHRALKAQDRPDGDPPIPAHHAAVTPPNALPAPNLAGSRAAAAPTTHPASRYRARAPPLSA